MNNWQLVVNHMRQEIACLEKNKKKLYENILIFFLKK